jgi:hypothetical protein
MRKFTENGSTAILIFLPVIDNVFMIGSISFSDDRELEADIVKKVLRM